MPDQVNRITREGLIAGIIGATSVAIWFLIVDTVTGRPLFTPLVLGDALFSVLGPAPATGPTLLDHPAVHIIGYTVFHYAAFIAVGTIVALVVQAAEKEPSVLLGFVVLFVVFEIAFHGFVALLQQSTDLRELAWYTVMIGNLIAAAGMGVYMWRAHPELREELAHALD